MRCGKTIHLLILAAGLGLAGGCTSFKTAWEKAATQPAAPDKILGRWEGSWRSDVNGHSGNLRCVVTQDRDGSYPARFHAIYRRVIGFGYTVKLHGVETNEDFKFSGEANLGWWAGGLYDYQGRTDGTNFYCSYSCKYDHGKFQMKRPPRHP